MRWFRGNFGLFDSELIRSEDEILEGHEDFLMIIEGEESRDMKFMRKK